MSGLAIEHLHVSPEDGQAYAIELPGEACGPRGRFGHPQYRIAVGGHRALDLRQVDGGCHAVAIDLESGDWGLLESSEAPGVCREMRRVPASLMRTALRGYHEEVEQALAAAGGDPSSAYSLRIAADGTSFAVTRDFEGAPLTVRAPRFPVRTPLRRIDVSVVGGGAQPGGARPVPAARRFEPL